MKQFIKNNNFITRHISDETIIVPVKGHVGDLDSVYTLNEVATLAWQLIDGQTSGKQIVEAICKEYDIAAEEAEKDLIELMGSLEATGLVRPVFVEQAD